MKATLPACALVLWAAVSAAAYDLPSSTGTHRVRFDADEAHFNEYTRVIDLSGQVKLEEVSEGDRIQKLIRARNLSVDMTSHTVVSPADFVMDDDTGTMYGQSGFMNYSDNTGIVNGVRFSYDKFIFRGAKVEFDAAKYVYKKASVTSCEEEPPHYRINSSRIYVAPGRYFLSYNNVFFLGSIPIFYFPVLYRPVGDGTPFVTSLFPGYDQRNGAYLKTNYAYRINPGMKVKAYLDYFSKRGLGMGGEVDYRKPEKTMANVSAYRIREYGATTDRWGLNGGYWHSFNRFNESDPAQYYSQSSFRLISDPAFNNDFFRTNPFAVSQDKQASLAFTRKTNYTVTRLSANVRDVRSSTDTTKFYRDSEAVPRLDFNTVPFKVLKLPVLNTFSAYMESGRDSAAEDYQKKARGVWTVSKPLPISRHVIISPSVFYDQAFFASSAPYQQDYWVGRYGGSVNLRYDQLWGSMDLKYSHTTRLRRDKMVYDAAAPDNGQETRSISGDLFIMPKLNAYFRARSSYDVRDYYTASFKKRLSPLITEAYYSPRPSLDLYAQDTYGFTGSSNSFVLQATAGGKEQYIGLGVANYSNDARAWVVSNSFGFRPGARSPWRAELVLRYRAVVSADGLEAFRFFEKSVTLYRDFHDFRTRWDFRSRSGGVKEFFFLVSLKVNDKAHRDDLDEKSRQFWRPWRQEGAARDY